MRSTEVHVRCDCCDSSYVRQINGPDEPGWTTVAYPSNSGRATEDRCPRHPLLSRMPGPEFKEFGVVCGHGGTVRVRPRGDGRCELSAERSSLVVTLLLEHREANEIASALLRGC